MFYCFRCLFVGIRPRDHHNEHRLDQAVTMVVSILSGKICGSSYECFTVLGVYLLDHHNEHCLDQAVTMVVLILSGKICGSSY